MDKGAGIGHHAIGSFSTMKTSIRKTSRDRRQEIEQTALDLAYIHTPQKVSTGMIAARLGLTQPAIYKHFSNKQDIWRAVGERLAGEIRNNISFGTKSQATPVSTLKQLVSAQLDLISQNPAMPELLLMRVEAGGSADCQVTIQSAIADFQRELEDNLHLGVKDKTFIETLNVQDAALLIMGVIQSSILRMIVRRDPGVLQKDGPRLLDLLLAGFVRKGEKA
ncbi:MAG: TetR/AcrR family transcriptional regulator [Devosiaceae bacterium]|nr:TetR/AcrR family transcriptional regulator [Devosiaceae bacterium]